jgi:menaquinone-dependent protoporphyrinogen IX oxidase
VDLLSLLSYLLIIIIGVPTGLLFIGWIIGYISSFTATGAITEKPASDPVGKALIVYEPGATKQTKKVGEVIGDLLLEKGYEVTLAGIRSEAARDTSGYKLLLLGTPTYIGRPTGLAKKYVKNLRPASGQVFGFYAIGTKGAPAVGLVPKAFLEAMNKALEESGIKAREMAFVGYAEFDYPEFVARLIADETELIDINKDVPAEPTQAS